MFITRPSMITNCTFCQAPRIFIVELHAQMLIIALPSYGIARTFKIFVDLDTDPHHLHSIKCSLYHYQTALKLSPKSINILLSNVANNIQTDEEMLAANRQTDICLQNYYLLSTGNKGWQISMCFTLNLFYSPHYRYLTYCAS